MNGLELYLLCFAAGVVFSMVSFFLGSIDVTAIHTGHCDLGSAPCGHGHGVHASPVSPDAHHGGGGARVSPLQSGVLAGFFSWFGAAGYALTQVEFAAWFVILPIALASGALGAGIIAVFVNRVLLRVDHSLDPAEYVVEGALGTVTIPIARRMTGEILIERASGRCWFPARTTDEADLSAGTEVVVISMEEGIARVRRCDVLASELPPLAPIRNARRM